MSKKFFFLLVTLGFLVCFSGCANLKTKKVPQYVPSLVEKELEIKIGMELLVDNRPEVDRKLTADIKNVPEEVTAKLVEYFKTAGPLKEIHYPAQEDDDIVISGEIRRFMWRSYSQAPTYIPIINLYVYLGIPCKTAYGLTGIYLELINNKTSQVIDSFDESSKAGRSYNLYKFREIDSAVELEESFKEVARELRSKIILKIKTFQHSRASK